MTPPPAVTVILPTYNRLQYLHAAIDSIRGQTFSDWELIIADDGSDAETQAYLANVARLPQVRTIQLQHSGLPGRVRNSAIREARGEFIAFIDSDDVWLPTKLESQAIALRLSRNCQWSYTEFTWINQAGESMDSQRNAQRVLHDGDVLVPLLQCKAGIALPTVMVKRALLERVGGFDEQLDLHEDYDLWLRLALLSPVKVVTHPLTYVRRHNQHFSRSGVPLLVSRLHVLQKTRPLLTDPKQLAVLRTERARAEASLAYLYAALGFRRPMVRTLLASSRHSWRNAPWYSGSAKALVRSVIPRWCVRALHKYGSERHLGP